MPSGLKRYQTFGHDPFVTFSCDHRLPYLDDDHSRTVFLEILERLRQRHQFHVYGGWPPTNPSGVPHSCAILRTGGERHQPPRLQTLSSPEYPNNNKRSHIQVHVISPNLL